VVVLIATPFAFVHVRLAKAADAPKTVYGVVYDEIGQPIAGATVTVTMKYGLDNNRSQLIYGPTDTDGYYLLVFDISQWMEHDTIEVVASRSGQDTATNSTEANPEGSQQVDVQFLELIPEFTNPAFVISAFCVTALLVFRGSRNRRRNTASR